MRKIEQQIIEALRNQKSFTAGNTSVEHYPLAGQVSIMECDLVGEVYLHGNLIARFNRATNQLDIYDGGWESRTTKSRLNALLNEFAPSYGIIQHKGQWYIIPNYYREDKIAWEGSATFRAGKLKDNG